MVNTMQTELDTALAAVRAAAKVTSAVQRALVTSDSLQKKDKSPVTVADFASQAVICAALGQAMADDPIVGEEDAAELRNPENAALCERVVEHVRRINEGASRQQVLDWIDRGKADGSTQRFWTLDPIDGTQGFLRKEQYAIALALIENGQVVLGVLGCPNLSGGVLLSAVQGQGAKQHKLDADEMEGEPIAADEITDPAAARLCESVESRHSNQRQSARIAEALKITLPPVRMDSQAKYAAIARGEAEIYLRLPTSKEYREKIWDHAAGMMIVHEAGGTVSDADGKPLDFSHGRRLEVNRGIIATAGRIHEPVVRAVRQVLRAKP